MGASAPLEAREARLIRPVEPRQHVLQDVGMDGGVFRERGADVFEFRFLLIAGDGDARSLPGADALL